MNALFSRWITIGIISLTLLENAEAGQSCGIAVGKFISIEGVIELEHANLGERQPATLESSLCQDDMIHVGENSRAAVSLINDVVLRLDQNTTMRLVDVAPQPEKRSMLELVVGAFKSFSRPPRTFAVNTPYINGLIEGTEFAMRVGDDSSIVTVYEGKVTTTNEKGRLTLKRGESALAKAGQAPQPYVMVKPRDAVQWTLHFPPLLAALGGGASQTPTDVSPVVKEALGLVSSGDTPGALALLRHVPPLEQDPNYHLYRSAMFLDVGRVDEARADIDAALAQDPKAGLAYALRAIIEVARNERPQALASAEKAVALNPSAAAKIALSYAQQSAFRLEAARDTLLLAVKEHPDNALAWARLGELWLMSGDRDKALDAARKAEALAPNLARTQDVKGFAALAENRESEAKSAFEKAVTLNSADPLAHFGLGLTKIKGGDLKEGRKDIEAAVALDSSNALLRSYLGKAYYEEKRFPLEGHQYSIAKELDPSDPTPYFYDALDKQTTNRPVEALQDMQKAIELNNNRAVYRSRLLLDGDLAARSASLARIYSDLGFQELALREGWKSANTDPSNFSAHRFLADSYSALPRHEIARVSELLQSQLLQPLNMTPIQPHLAESNLFLIGAGGPAALAFNEFNPIYNRNGITVQANGLVGENDTYAGEGIISGISGKAAFSVGGFHSTSNGFRKNDEFSDDIANAFVQYELTPKTSVQAEYRYRSTDSGDLFRRFFEDNFSLGERNDVERHTYRLGARHSFSENSTIIGSFIYQNAVVDQTDDQVPGIPTFLDLLYSSHRPEDSLGFELQHLFRSQYINLISGVGHSSVNGRFDTRNDVRAFDITFTDSAGTDLDHTNVYGYSYLKPMEKLVLTLGLSGDFTDGDSPDMAGIKQANPKFGVTWEPVPGTTFRAAAFRSLKRTLITNQTIEPTQIAGFNQFFDDFNGTSAWRYGAGIDQKFTKTIFGGVEISRRDLDVKSFTILPNSVIEKTTANWQENLARSYFFWTPHPWVALRAEYQYEHINRDIFKDFGIQKMDTQRVPLGISLFHPSGWNLGMTATYYNQHGVFDRLDFQSDLPGRDNFWLIDAGLSYRLPKRYGLITVGASNIFDEQFQYYDTDFNNPRIHQGRMVFGKLTLALP